MVKFIRTIFIKLALIDQKLYEMTLLAIFFQNKVDAILDYLKEVGLYQSYSTKF